jgi:hypothetical protein
MQRPRHAIIFTGANYLDSGRKGGGATRIANHCENSGWNIEVVEYLSFWSTDQIADFLKQQVTEDTKWIGFSYTWLSNDHSLPEKIKFIKGLYPNLLTIVGGQTQFEQDLGVDYYIFGYGEEAVLKVLNYEFDNGSPVKYTRLFGGKYIDGIHSYTSHNLMEYGVTYKDIDFLTPKDLVTIELSRGCKFACKFCNFPYIGVKEDTSRTEESIYRELNENYQKWGITKFLIADDTLNDRNEKLIKLRNAVNRLDFTPDFSGYIRLDLFKSHPEHLEILAESRVWGHFYGIETFNHDTGKIIGKGMHPDTMKQLLLDTRSYFNKQVGLYRGSAAMIAGLPKESIESMRASHQWYLDNWTDQTLIWHPLQIMKTQGSMQAFGKDLVKFGYEEITGPTAEIHQEYLNKSLVPKINEKTAFWRNEYCDSYEILKLVDEFRQAEFPLSNWILWSFFTHYSMDEAMAIKCPPYDVFFHKDFTDKAKQHIESYISKKLAVRL